MSRAIEIRVSESVVRTVHVEDGVQSTLEVLPILPGDRMADLLAAELEKQGFTRDGDTAKRTDPDGVEITVNLKDSTVSVKLGSSQVIKESGERKTMIDEDFGKKSDAETSLKGKLVDDLEKKVEERTTALRQKVTKQLEDKLGDLKKELDTAISRTTVNALTEKAQQLGQIQETSSDEAGNVTIRVRL